MPEGHFKVDFQCFFFYVPVAGGISSTLKYSIEYVIACCDEKMLNMNPIEILTQVYTNNYIKKKTVQFEICPFVNLTACLLQFIFQDA